jgi:hypothetical protein
MVAEKPRRLRVVRYDRHQAVRIPVAARGLQAVTPSRPAVLSTPHSFQAFVVVHGAQIWNYFRFSYLPLW